MIPKQNQEGMNSDLSLVTERGLVDGNDRHYQNYV